MYEVSIERGFEAAHFLPDHPKCGGVHGHSYKVQVTVGSRELNENGMVMDFGKLKEIIDPLLPDHRLLNDLYDFPPTAENLASYFYWQLNDMLPIDIQLIEVTVQETDGARATYYG